VYLLVVSALGLGAHPAPAQQQRQTYPSPRLLVLSPNGGRASTTFELTLSGQDLEEPEGLLFSQPGIKADPIGTPNRPKPDPRMRRPNPGQPQALTTARFKVTIPADTAVGIHDVRLVSRWGISNPRAFVVGDLAEVLEKEPNDDVDKAQRVELNSTINGTISTPTDVDYYVFAGKKGQRVLASCLSSSIDSRLLAAVELYDPAGRLLTSNRNYSGTDALLDATLPADGDYQVRVFCFTYTQGSPQHFYRLSITTAPWIDAVYPPMVEPGKPTPVTVYGRNLPGGQPDPSAVLDGCVLEKLTATIEPPKDPEAAHRLRYAGYVAPKSAALDGFAYRVRNDAGTSNPYLITFARAPVVLDRGDNDDAEHAQEIPLPCEIAGRIEARRDHDWYSFTAHRGEVYSIEAYADRIGAPMNLYFALRNAKGQTVAQSADSNEVLHPQQFFSRTDDPQRYRFSVPADGTYTLMVTSREASIQCGPRDLYRVRIAPEQPDFRLIVMPPSTNSPEGCTLHQGGHQYYAVHVWRLDGFNGDVTLRAEGLPAGVSCPTQTVAGTTKQGVLALNAGPEAESWTGRIRVIGTATIAGREVVREARPATITWPVPPQINVATVSRLDRDLVLAVRDKAPFTLNAKTDKELFVQSGQRVTVALKVVRRDSEFKAPVQVTAVNLVPGLIANNNQPLTIAPGKDEANVVLNVGVNVQPGTYTVVFRGLAQVPVVRDARTKQRQNLALIQPSNPVTVTVLPRQVARLSVDPGGASLKPGREAQLTVRVQRLANYDGEFKVELVIPSGTKGIHAEEVTIPKGKDQAKLVIEAEEDATPGNRGNLVVRATARLKGKVSLTQEARINVNVQKP
jgi:hypothetical protein